MKIFQNYSSSSESFSSKNFPVKVYSREDLFHQFENCLENIDHMVSGIGKKWTFFQIDRNALEDIHEKIEVLSKLFNNASLNCDHMSLSECLNVKRVINSHIQDLEEKMSDFYSKDKKKSQPVKEELFYLKSIFRVYHIECISEKIKD
ncbi:MAG TPA: hypothetical protein DHW82_02945 [Spirochaetia bacterium]|nr:MAG: hypothetical protein A2Y41_00670 [Spirochaetes bacterium GWB1_36_13]HCL55948.1 hypothetical protein [Spirochaetia bacterium]